MSLSHRRLLTWLLGLAALEIAALPGEVAAQAATGSASDWRPAAGPLITQWGTQVTPETAHREYPRPQMVRSRWLNLNGLWQFAVAKKDASRPDRFDRRILVPFPIESALSGVMARVAPDERLWYRCTFTRPDSWVGNRVLLHFGAVDWDTEVWVNGRSVGQHRGGYDRFQFDITESLKAGDEQEIVVAVADATDAGTQPRGKQIRNPHGIWYTPTTGIWQTVWLEPVPKAYIESLRITADIDRAEIGVAAQIVGDAAGKSICVEVYEGDHLVATEASAVAPVRVKIPAPKLWSPQEPFLYDLRVTLSTGDVRDQVASYCGMRKIALGKSPDGHTRMLLNDQFVFQYGPLDQGFWPDGLYAAPSDVALRYDIEITKRLGFNMARKHVKVEPERWYYWCDRLGLLVWQDMPSGDRYIRADSPDIQRTPESTAQFEREWSAIIQSNYNHPCIVMWVPFNEGWGQFDTARIVDFTRKLDPTRLVDSASGWTDRGVGDVHDIHVYPGPGMPRPEPKRAAVLGEFGGLGLPIEEHTWQAKANWGYRSFTTSEALTDAFVLLTRQLHPMVGQGLSAAVYTQTTDVEIEVNGLMTYDRARIKMDAARITAANQRLYQTPPVLKPVIETSQVNAQAWRYTIERPADAWFTPDFDDANWQEGNGGFGTEGTPGTTVRTTWRSSDIWIRRAVMLDAVPAAPMLVIHHDEDAKVYINGQRVIELKGYTTGYVTVPLGSNATSVLQKGRNTIAVHCRQTGGGQYIDIGMVDEIAGK